MAVIVDSSKSLQLVVAEEVAATPLLKYPMLNRLQKRAISQKLLKWNANVGGAAAIGQATTASVSSYSEDAVIGASLPIGANRILHAFSVQKEDIAEARATGAGALRDLFGYEIQSGIRILMERLSTALYSGTGTATDGGMVGLGAVVANAAYAGIDPATYTSWSAVLNTNGTNRSLTLTLLVNLEAALVRKGGSFTAVYTTPEVVARYKEVFAANLSINNILPAGQADLGYTGLSYAGRPVIQDPYCTANTLYFVDEAELTLFTFSQDNTQAREGMQIAIEPLPSDNPDALRYAIYVKPQLKVLNRSKGVAALAAITQ